MSGIIPRAALRAPTARALARQNLSRRFVSTTPPAHRSRSFKSSLARWTLAIGGVWYLSSSDILAEGKIYPQRLPETASEDENLPTVDSLAAARRERQTAAPQAVASPTASDVPAKGPTDMSGEAQQLEEEAEGEGAFNPETGEINWDCPCLGGMAHGPCGPQFREAFSCFVYSHEEPKGIECIDRFKSMQDCFRAHPDVYGAELTDDPTDEELEENARAAEQQAQQSKPVVADAPYSGASGPQDKVPGANLTSTPSASPGSVSSTTSIPNTARSADEGTARKQ